MFIWMSNIVWLLSHGEMFCFDPLGDDTSFRNTPSAQISRGQSMTLEPLNQYCDK